jgi:hypothetical protein
MESTLVGRGPEVSRRRSVNCDSSLFVLLTKYVGRPGGVNTTAASLSVRPLAMWAGAQGHADLHSAAWTGVSTASGGSIPGQRLLSFYRSSFRARISPLISRWYVVLLSSAADERDDHDASGDNESDETRFVHAPEVPVALRNALAISGSDASQSSRASAASRHLRKIADGFIASLDGLASQLCGVSSPSVRRQRKISLYRGHPRPP